MNRAADSTVARSARTVSLAVFGSRILGLVREQILAGLFGASREFDAFITAFRIPNLLRDLFAEGALSAAFVATFTQKLERDFFSDKRTSFSYSISDLRVDLLKDDVAIATFYMDWFAIWNGFESTNRDRLTFVMLFDGDKWKIVHEHISPFPGFPLDRPIGADKKTQ